MMSLILCSRHSGKPGGAGRVYRAVSNISNARELRVIARGKTNSNRPGDRRFVIAIFAALTAAPAAFAADMRHKSSQ
jgi:hypothetical protein